VARRRARKRDGAPAQGNRFRLMAGSGGR
jgi:hypothetical protein